MDRQNFLEECEMSVCKALHSDNRQVKIDTLLYLKQHVHGIDNELTEHWEEWKKQDIGRSFTTCNMYLSSIEDLNLNLYFSIDIINNKLNHYYNASISNDAVKMIFFPPVELSKEDVLYSNDQGKKFTVSDFLSALDYAKKFSETYLGVDYEKYSEALLAIKTVDLALHHKKEDKPLNKTLHIVNNVLTECAKEAHKRDEGKRIVSGISLIIDLAIDFLVQR